MKKSKVKIKGKALCLLSGGLDSRLACKIMQEQCEVEAVFFILPFGAGCCSDKFCVFRFTQSNAIKLHIIDFTKGNLFREYFNTIKKPRHGYGSAINPCIDCHIFMLKEAKKIARKIHADIIVTGEVLNERPMSQHLNALKIVEKEAGLKGRLLRPLSAKLLPETEAEKTGLIAREKLLAIQGRSRKQQLELAKKYKISFPSPAGGCLLCEKEFAAKFRDLLKHKKAVNEMDIGLLNIGRHFRINGIKVIVGRNHNENLKIKELASKSDLLLEAVDVPSPITLIKGKAGAEIIKKAAEITARYSDAETDEVLVVLIKKNKETKMKVKKAPDEEIGNLRIGL